uniref:Uncharacterized protein n=1 Tax=Arundo donax TaxID=35708 RepID=A0A0A9C311_ARUDO
MPTLHLMNSTCYIPQFVLQCLDFRPQGVKTLAF